VTERSGGGVSGFQLIRQRWWSCCCSTMPKKKPAKKPAAKKPRAKKPAATKKQGGAKKKQGGGTARKKLDEEVQSGQRSVVQHPDVAGIRFSQNSVDNKFTDGKSMEDLIAKLRSGEARTGEIGPPTIAGPKYLVMFRVGRHFASLFAFLQEGDVVTLDNRRLHCMKVHKDRCSCCLHNIRIRAPAVDISGCTA